MLFVLGAFFDELGLGAVGLGVEFGDTGALEINGDLLLGNCLLEFGYLAQFALAANVIGVVMTSSPSLIPAAIHAQ